MSSPDPVFVAIERHRLADAAYDAALDREPDESLKTARQVQEQAALVDLLRTKPETLVGCLASMRYIADWAENNEVGLFHNCGRALIYKPLKHFLVSLRSLKMDAADADERHAVKESLGVVLPFGRRKLKLVPRISGGDAA